MSFEDNMPGGMMQVMQLLNDPNKNRRTQLNIDIARMMFRMVSFNFGNDDSFFAQKKKEETPSHYAGAKGTNQAGLQNNELVDINETTPLLVALEENHFSVAELLINSGANVNVQNKLGRSPLHISCSKDDFFQGGEAINAEGAMPLQVLEGNYFTVAKMLLKFGAIINVKDKKGKTPLHYACAKNDCLLVQMLLNNGALVDAEDEENTTPLLQATKGNHFDVSSLLLEHGAIVNVKGKNGKTPLAYACEKDNYRLAEVFLKNGAEVNEEDAEGTTLLLEVLERGCLNLAKILLQYNASVNVCGKLKKTPLHYASTTNDENLVEALLRKGAFIDAADAAGRTPLLQALEGNHLGVVMLLLKFGANVNVQDKEGRRPIHYVYTTDINLGDLTLKFDSLLDKEDSEDSEDSKDSE